MKCLQFTFQCSLFTIYYKVLCSGTQNCASIKEYSTVDAVFYTVMYTMSWSSSTFAGRGGIPRHQIFSNDCLSSLTKSVCMRVLTECTKNLRISRLKSFFLSYFTRFLCVQMASLASPLNTRREVTSRAVNSIVC